MAGTQHRSLNPNGALHRAPSHGRHGYGARRTLARTLVGAGAGLLCAVALACGSGDSGDGYGEESASEAPAVSAQESAESGSGARATAPEVQSCLDLVGQARFREAVPVCLRAVEAAPGNAEVKQALDRAQREVATSEAGQAAESAKEAAESEAGKAAEGASKALEGMGD